MENKQKKANEETLAHTGAYPMYELLVCPARNIKKVPDLATGGTRKRKLALVFSMSAFPDFANVAEPIMTPSGMDTMLIDADSIEELRARAIIEVDDMMTKIQEALEIKAKMERGEYDEETTRANSSSLPQA